LSLSLYVEPNLRVAKKLTTRKEEKKRAYKNDQNYSRSHNKMEHWQGKTKNWNTLAIG